MFAVLFNFLKIELRFTSWNCVAGLSLSQEHFTVPFISISTLPLLLRYHVELDDTILFPEGGGQPDDRGTINNVPVMKISRKGAKVVTRLHTVV